MYFSKQIGFHLWVASVYIRMAIPTSPADAESTAPAYQVGQPYKRLERA